MLQPIPFSSLFKVLQSKEIAAGSSAVVFIGKIPKTHIGFLEKVGTSDWLEDTWFIWQIDNVVVEKVERVIGFINSPAYYNPPLVVKDEIRWTGYNDSDTDHYFEVLNDGLAYPKGYRFKR